MEPPYQAVMRRRLAAGAGAGGLAALGWWLFLRVSTVASGADQVGYLGLARSLARGALADAAPVLPNVSAHLSPWVSTPLGYVPKPLDATIASVYPPGLPTFFAAGWLVFRDLELAVRGVMVLHGLLVLLLIYRLGRVADLPRPHCFLLSAVLATNPVFLRSFLLPESDGPAATWALASVFFAFRSRSKKSYAFLAGLAFGVGVAVRPTNALICLCLLFAFGLSFRLWALFVAGLLIPVALLGLYNAAQFGSPWRFGYGDVGWRFRWRYFPPRAWHFLSWLSRFLTPLVFPMAISALTRRTDEKIRRLRWGMSVWFVVFFCFYGFYWFSKDAWWSLRFLLPALPGLLVAAALGVRRFEVGFSRGLVRPLAGLLVSVWALFSGLSWSLRLKLPELAAEEEVWREAAMSAGRWTGDEGWVLCGDLSGAIWFYGTHAFVRWDRLQPQELSSILEAMPTSAKAIAVLWPREEKVVERLFPGLLADRLYQGRYVVRSVVAHWRDSPHHAK